jgi:hypothetical protein
MQQSFRSKTVVVAALTLLASAAAAPADDPKPDANGWIPLFTGKDLDDWQVHEKTNPKEFRIINGNGVGRSIQSYVGFDKLGANSKRTILWEVINGTLIGSRGKSHLFTKKADFEDFHLRIEAKINNFGNSGVFIRAPFSGGVPKGYEAQINASHAEPYRTGGLNPAGPLAKYRTKIGVKTAPHLPQEFFILEVIALGPRIRVLVNGKQTADFTDPDNTYKKGCIALQCYDAGTVATFKKIEWKPIPK